MKIKFGVFVPQVWRRDLVDMHDPINQYERIKEVALEAENLGFDSIWLVDHLQTPTFSSNPCLECWVTQSALAEATKSIRLGQMVTCNSYRYPSVLAKMASTLDNISKGRVEFGIGAGWYENEYIAYGIPFPSAAERIAQLGEAVQIIKKMWTEEEAYFEGKYYRIKGAYNSPKPVQRPHPPIWVGGGGEKLTLRIVAKYADGCNFISSPEEYSYKLELLKKYCEENGRKPNTIMKSLTTDITIARKEDEVKKLKKLYVNRKYVVTTLRHPLKALSFAKRYLSGHITPCDIMGTPEKCVEQISQYADLGVTHFMLYFSNVNSSRLQLFADKVIPNFS